MEKGSYRERRVVFKRYAVSCFNPFLFCDPASELRGCGAGALALLTGIAPEIISAKNGGAHYPDTFMRRFLRRHGFRTLQLTQCNVSAAKDSVGTEHVILISQLFAHNEGTWGILFGSIYYHNFTCYAASSLSLLNKPVLSAYLVVHPRWQEQPRGQSRRKIAGLNKRLNSVGRIMQSPALISQSQIKV
jgi:hypothetical protein